MASKVVPGDPGSKYERGQWGNRFDFTLSALGFAVGLGNVWRFPYLCGRSGGAAFLIPYGIMMVFTGLPLFYLELALGQFSSLGPMKLYQRMSPLFGGIGFAMTTICFCKCVYYNMIVGWALYYFVVSLQKDLPWSSCTHEYNSNNCFEYSVAQDCCSRNESFFRGQCGANSSDPSIWFNITSCTFNVSSVSPAHDYFSSVVLKESSGLEDFGTPDWKLVASLGGAWVITFLLLVKGIKSHGKAVYFTSTFPYLIIVALLIRGVTLTGAKEGLDFYLNPDYSYLKKSGTWRDAVTQIFFSLGCGTGGLPTLASYNKFNNNILSDTVFVVLGNCLTSFIAGLAIFPAIGHVAYQTGTSVAELADQGSGLAFIIYPYSLGQIPLPQLWCALFFFMLLLLGVDSQPVKVEMITTTICDTWPVLRKPIYKTSVTAAVCFFMFLVGITMTCPAGNYVVNLVDTFAGGWPLVLTGLFELIVVSYVYGIRQFIKDVQLMMGRPPNVIEKPSGYFGVLCLVFISPVFLLFVLIFNWVSYQPLKLGDYVYPPSAEVMAWLITSLSAVYVVGYALYITCRFKKQGYSLRLLIRPLPSWGPAQVVKS